MKHYAKRKDRNESEIVGKLKQVGVWVHLLGDPVDLLVHYRGVSALIEVKDKGTEVKRSQMGFFTTCRMPIGIARTFLEAMEIIAGNLAFTDQEKFRIEKWLNGNPNVKQMAVNKFLTKVVGRKK